MVPAHTGVATHGPGGSGCVRAAERWPHERCSAQPSGLAARLNEAETRADAPDRVVLRDCPGANPACGALLRHLGFAPISATLRMCRGTQPRVSLADVNGLACLELG